MKGACSIRHTSLKSDSERRAPGQHQPKRDRCCGRRVLSVSIKTNKRFFVRTGQDAKEDHRRLVFRAGCFLCVGIFWSSSEIVSFIKIQNRSC